MRLFLALSLPAPLRDRLAALCTGVPGARWVAPENLHLTLRFIGEVDGSQARDLDTALAQVRAARLAVTLDGVDRFGSGRVRVISGEAPAALAGLPDPNSVFVGGSGGMLNDILDTVAARLKRGGRIVVNLAALERTQEVYHQLRDLGLSPEMTMINAARGKEFNDGTVRLEAMNPVFIITASREGPANE